MRNSAIKTFHFGTDFMEALEDLMECYLVLTAQLELLRGTVGEGSYQAEQIARDIKRADATFVRMIKKLPKDLYST